MPIRTEAGLDPLSLYLRLASSRGAAMPLDALRQQFGSGVEQLFDIGAAHPGRPLSVITCPACYEGHSAEVAYDAATLRSSIFCPESGRVWVEDSLLRSLHLNTDWLPDQLSFALGVAPSPPRRTVIEGAAWLLGDMVVGSTGVSVALAIGIKGTSELQMLVEGLQRRQPLEIGLLLVAPDQPPDCIFAAANYHSVALTELAVFADGQIKVDQARLGAWIRSLARGRSQPVSSHVGRPSIREKILHVFQTRRHRGEPYISKLKEARAIRSEWSTVYPDIKSPGYSTMRNHLPDL